MDVLETLGGLAASVPAGFTPLGDQPSEPDLPGPAPQSIGELGELVSYTYDLTARRAADLNIPVFGSGQGGFDRRVVVLEWARYKEMPDKNSVKYRYGFVIRFCLTVNKWDSQAKLSLPFLSAQAQMGQIEATWMMQVRGLSGQPIDNVVVPPKELNVQTFVLATQSIDLAIKAIGHQDTRFVPGIVLSKIDPMQPETLCWLSAVRAYSAASLARGRTRAQAVGHLGAKDPAADDIITETYELFGVTDPAAHPGDPARKRASAVLRNIKLET